MNYSRLSFDILLSVLVDTVGVVGFYQLSHYQEEVSAALEQLKRDQIDIAQHIDIDAALADGGVAGPKL